LSAFADKKWGKGKDKIDDEDITFQRMVAKVSGSRFLSLPPSPPKKISGLSLLLLVESIAGSEQWTPNKMNCDL